MIRALFTAATGMQAQQLNLDVIANNLANVNDSHGQLVNSDRFVLQPAISITADAQNISIGSDGTVSVITASSPNPQQLGQVQLARFVNPAGLNAIGRNLFLPTQASGTPTTGNAGQQGYASVGQGFLESSNVSVVEEMVNVIAAQRAFEVNSKAIKTADEMLALANNVMR